jgi:hypothetical protein
MVCGHAATLIANRRSMLRQIRIERCIKFFLLFLIRNSRQAAAPNLPPRVDLLAKLRMQTAEQTESRGEFPTRLGSRVLSCPLSG